MVFTIDFLDDGPPLAWALTEEPASWRVSRADDYAPTVYAVTRAGMERATPDAGDCRSRLVELRGVLRDHPAVVGQRIVTRQPGLRFPSQPVLAVDVDRTRRVRSVAQYIEDRGPPGRVPYRAFDVDLSPEFRVCLDRDWSPVPTRSPSVSYLGLSRAAAADEDLTALTCSPRPVVGSDAVTTARSDARPAGDTVSEVLDTIQAQLTTHDPDVLAVERGEIVPLLGDAAAARDRSLGLPRVPPDVDADAIPAYQRLAGESTFESYGTRHHSPARYNVPGRVLVDLSNTFFLEETNLAGCLGLVRRSRKPLQELSWASIGNVLTAIQIRKARSRNVLVQWRAWRPERFKTATELHAADRGGTTLAPAVGLHENVHELDFASLYPNIICRHNLSPETVRCRCHDTADVPELGYSVCESDGFLPGVLQPIVDDRAAMKRTRREEDLTAHQRARLDGQVSALKWILVSCFGYQGFSNAKFGRIEVHEAINAYARDVLLTAKRRLEANGWRVLHGIVDSIWVTPRSDAEQTPLADVAAAVTREVGITLEYESAFEWVAFCARRDGDAGALTRYFGRRREPDDEPYKLRGIECRQRSTPAWIASAQRSLIDVLDETHHPDAVVRELCRQSERLGERTVPATELLVRQRTSKPIDGYEQETRVVSALRRARARDREIGPGEDVRFLVVDDEITGADRVRLASEVTSETRYDPTFYRELLLRAATSVLSVFGWSQYDVRDAVRAGHDTVLPGAST